MVLIAKQRRRCHGHTGIRRNVPVETDEDGYLKLTELGLETAENTYERHTVLSNFFEKLGVSKEVASEDACRIEHHISPVSFQALKNFVENM